MPINKRYLKDGTIRYEARLNKRGPGRCTRFNTREQAEKKLAEWKALTPQKTYSGRIVNQHNYDSDIKALWTFFLYGRA